MLETINRNKKSIMGTFVVVIVALTMLPFGVDMLATPKRTAAISVNEVDVSHEDFYRERRNLENRYRQIFGENYERFAGMVNYNQQVVDGLISNALLEGLASDIGLVASRDELQEILLQSGMFQGGFNPETYRYFLKQSGLSAQQFESKLRAEALREQLRGIMQASTYVSKAEVNAMLERQETTFSAMAVEFDPLALVKEVAEPKPEDLKEYYETHSTDYEEPAQVAYSFVELRPSDFVAAVEVLPEDIEVYYADHEADYKEPEQAQVRHIQLSFDAGADQKVRDDKKAQAQTVREKLLAGEPFEKLAAQFSDDFATKDLGGDLGTVRRGRLAKSLEKAVFDLGGPGLSEVIETDKAYHVLRVDAYKAESVQPLETVKGAIEKILREEQAPAYTAEHAQALYDSWRKSRKSLSEFVQSDAAKGTVLALKQSKGLLTEQQNPEGVLGLTDKVIDQASSSKQQLVELPSSYALVDVSEYKEPAILPFEKVQAKVVESVKQSRAPTLARERAKAMLESITSGKYADLKGAADASKIKPLEAKDLSRAKPGSGAFANPALTKIIFSANKAGEKPNQVIEAGGKFYLLQVTAITKPSAATLAEKAKGFESQARSRADQLLMGSLVNALKAKADIHVDEALLAEG